MALALDPQLIIMDEPTTALDVVVQREIIEQITELRNERGFSVIFITHDLPMLLEITDRIAVMKTASLWSRNTSENIYWNAQHPYTKASAQLFPVSDGRAGADFVRTGAIDSEVEGHV